MDISREALESALGGIALRAIEEQKNQDLALELAKEKAIQTLQKIQDILEDQDLSDEECVEEIVVVFHDAGFTTFRHDYG